MTPNENIKFKSLSQARAMDVQDNPRNLKVEGYAARYEAYLLYDWGDDGKVYERFEPGCFDSTDMSDVILQYDHEGRVFARTTNGTLRVAADEQGLFITADLSKTERAKDLYEDIKAGMITKMSWRFRVGDYHVEREEGSKDVTIVHTRVPKIYDVSAVSLPANNNTEINARSWVDGVIAQAARSEAELEERRRKVRLKIKLGGITK